LPFVQNAYQFKHNDLYYVHNELQFDYNDLLSVHNNLYSEHDQMPFVHNNLLLSITTEIWEQQTKNFKYKADEAFHTGVTSGSCLVTA